MTPLLPSAHTQKFQPQIITGINILPPEGEDKNRAIANLDAWRLTTPAVAFTVLPEIGDEIIVQLLDGGFAVLEVMTRMHWAREVPYAKRPKFKGKDQWVDVVLTCRQRSCSSSKERRDSEVVHSL
ncbi:MAG: hypothetical protein V3S25_11575 [Nitrospirales bacterium]